MKARKMIDELIDIIDELGNVDIRSKMITILSLYIIIVTVITLTLN